MTRKLGCFFPMVLAVALAATGCCHDLQEHYVESMEATYEAVIADVNSGLYKPDELSQETLDKWKKANADARAVLESDK